MRYEYKIIKGNLVGPGGSFQSTIRKMQNLIFHGMNNLPITEEDKDLSSDVEYEFGGSFMPCEGTYEEHPLYLSPMDIIDKYKDRAHELDCYISKFTYMTELDKQRVYSGYIGKWNNNIDKESKIYYILMPDGPHKMFITNFNNMQFTPEITKVQYVVNINGNMMDCIPEEGDVLFDDFEEASKYFKDVYIGKMKLKHEAEEKETQRIKDEEENGKPIESLGDGIYIGQQAGNIFYYQGQKFKSPIGIRCIWPINVIIDIKDGKVYHRDWTTKI